MKQLFEKASGYINKKGTDTQKTLFKYLIGDETKEGAIQALREYQNEDGGWANGIEIEYQGDVSSPMSTAAALSYIYFFDLANTDLLNRTLVYLENIQKTDGSWDDSKEIKKFEISSYYGPEKFLAYKTGMIIKWLKKLNVENSPMIDKAIDYMIKNFETISKEQDFWAALGYANAFAELPQLKETPEILEWVMSILKPPTLNGKKNSELSWPQVQGMIYDDDRMLEPLKDKVIDTIKKRQLKNGDWPHRFGVYNKVWAAILMIRFLRINNQL